MMRYLSYLIIPLVIAVVLVGINREGSKAEKGMDENNFVVRQSKIVMWIGIICALFFGVLIILMSAFPNDTAQWWVYLIFFLFVILGTVLAVHCMIWALKISGDEIRHTAIFKKEQSISFGDITKVKIKRLQNNQMEEIKVYSHDKKVFSVESYCRGYHILIARLQKEGVAFEEVRG